VPAENYPFCTLEPNMSRVAVPDDRYDKLCELYQPRSRVSAFLQVTDIAGLVRGAHAGEGLGNAFLSHIRAVDGIFHVVRAFYDAEVIHVEGAIDPIRDLEIISEELLLKDMDTVTTHMHELEKVANRTASDRKKREELAICQKIHEIVCVEKKQVRTVEWKLAEIEVLNEMQLLTAKPVVYLVNLCEDDFTKKRNRWLMPIKQWIDAHSKETLIPFCCTLESKLMTMTPEQVNAYCTENKVASSLPKIIRTGYHALSLVHFFTCGEDEVRAWTIRVNTRAPQAAGVIHTDFEKGFICAEVMKTPDILELKNENAVKAAGKYRQEGKNYIMLDGDIVLFKFNVSQGKKK